MSWPTSQTENRLRESLIEAGFDFDQPDLLVAVKVFRRFVSEPVECADDGVLFECGTYGFTGEKRFSWGFVRQFSLDEDGEYDHMEQLQLKFFCAPSDELAGLQTNLWAYDFGDIDAYFVALSALPEFQIPLQMAQNWECVLNQGDV